MAILLFFFWYYLFIFVSVFISKRAHIPKGIIQILEKEIEQKPVIEKKPTEAELLEHKKLYQVHTPLLMSLYDICNVNFNLVRKPFVSDHSFYKLLAKIIFFF